MDQEVSDKIVEKGSRYLCTIWKTLVVDESGCILCPDCKTRVRTGNGGVQNLLQRHRSTAQCAVNKKKRQAQESIERTKENAMKWFRPRAPAIPPTVTAPALVNAALQPSAGSSSSMGKSAYVPPTLSGCPVGIALLRKFRARINALPIDVGEADKDHPLAAFAGDPVGCVGEDEDAWEKFDRPLNTLLQRPPGELQQLVRVGERGLIGLCH